MSGVILLEFNEICPPLIDQWMRSGKLPSFAAFHRTSQVFTTIADESEPLYLEPWIQWYSIHTGLPYRTHQVFYLTDGPKAPHDDIWRHLRSAGKSVMNISSMNVRPLAGEKAVFLPDPWCTTESAFPPELEPFRRVVSHVVQEYTRESGLLPWRDGVAFAAFMATHGMSAKTVGAILGQLAHERIAGRDVKWKRVSLMDRLQFDLFRDCYRRHRPDFATFFINSTAHLQHAYWRHMDPDSFTVRPPPEELEAYGDAVLYGYQAMDRLLAEFMGVAGDDAVLILCSGLSQQPFLRREAEGGQHFYRARDIAGFLRSIGIEPQLIEPLMTHQYLLRFRGPDEMASARAVLERSRLAEEQVFLATPSGEDSLYVGCRLFRPIGSDQEIFGIPGRNTGVKFFDVFYPIEGIKSGRHHPNGVLWIRTGRHALHDGLVSILDIAPTICDLVGVPPMEIGGESDIRGTSLIGRFDIDATV